MGKIPLAVHCPQSLATTSVNHQGIGGIDFSVFDCDFRCGGQYGVICHVCRLRLSAGAEKAVAKQRRDSVK
ncbi:MAG TPA: hypothetical protein DEB25_07500 [Desulfobulbaceae bacterium]|nr:hypothetical protein [Desulfobulbaceae bacterium]